MASLGFNYQKPPLFPLKQTRPPSFLINKTAPPPPFFQIVSATSPSLQFFFIFSTPKAPSFPVISFSFLHRAVKVELNLCGCVLFAFSFSLRRRRVGSPAMTSDFSGESKLWGKDEIFLVVHESSSFFQPPFVFSQLPFPFPVRPTAWEYFSGELLHLFRRPTVIKGRKVFFFGFLQVRPSLSTPPLHSFILFVSQFFRRPEVVFPAALGGGQRQWFLLSHLWTP